MKVGDWVQTVERVTEEDFQGEATFTHAEIGAIGHLLDVLDDGWVNVFFEKTGTQTICQVGELKRICNFTGSLTPTPISKRKS